MIDETKAGFPFSVFVSVKLVRQVDEELKEFETSIRTYPEVVDCWSRPAIVTASCASRHATLRSSSIPDWQTQEGPAGCRGRELDPAAESEVRHLMISVGCFEGLLV